MQIPLLWKQKPLRYAVLGLSNTFLFASRTRKSFWKSWVSMSLQDNPWRKEGEGMHVRESSKGKERWSMSVKIMQPDYLLRKGKKLQ